MMLSISFALSALLGLIAVLPVTVQAAALNTPALLSRTSGHDHRILVGGPDNATVLTFRPSNITAQPGDTVTFEFHQKNHTVTQSTFAAPCRPIADTSTNHQVGFHSGFMPVPANATKFPTYTIRVNDTKPIWVFCLQGDHCGMGMVFAVNAIESSSECFGSFQARARHINGTTDND